MVLLRSRRSYGGEQVVEPVNLEVRVPPNRHDNDPVEIVPRPRVAFERAKALDASLEKQGGLPRDTGAGPLRSAGKRAARQDGRSPYAKPAEGKGKASVDKKRVGPVPLRSEPSIGTQVAGAMSQLHIDQLIMTGPVSSRTRRRGAESDSHAGPSQAAGSMHPTIAKMSAHPALAREGASLLTQAPGAKQAHGRRNSELLNSSIGSIGSSITSSRERSQPGRSSVRPQLVHPRRSSAVGMG